MINRLWQEFHALAFLLTYDVCAMPTVFLYAEIRWVIGNIISQRYRQDSFNLIAGTVLRYPKFVSLYLQVGAAM